MPGTKNCGIWHQQSGGEVGGEGKWVIVQLLGERVLPGCDLHKHSVFFSPQLGQDG